MASATHYNIVQEQKMVQLTNPFVVQIDPKSPSSLKGTYSTFYLYFIALRVVLKNIFLN